MTIQSLFRRPNRWTQGELARDANGDGTIPNWQHKFAKDWTKPVCFCLSGAVDKCYGDAPWQTRKRVLRRIREAIACIKGRRPNKWRNESIVGWNDVPGRTIQEIRAVVRAAGV